MESLGEKIQGQGFVGNQGPDKTIVTQILQIFEFFVAISRLLSTREGQTRYDLLSVYMDAASTLAQCVLTNPGAWGTGKGQNLLIS